MQKAIKNKTQNTYRLSIFLFTIVVLLGSNTQIYADSLQQVLTKIENHNLKINSISAGISANGYLQRNKFKATGRIWSDHKQNRLKIRFEDLIFKSPISIFLLMGERVYLYYPPRKKKIITSRKRFRPAYDAGLPLEADLLQAMMQGHFYIPKNLQHKKYDSKKHNLILVSPKYIINYLLNKQGLPYKGIILNRATKKRVIFVFSGFRKKSNVYIPHHIKIYPPIRGNYMNIYIHWLYLNPKLGNVWYLG